MGAEEWQYALEHPTRTGYDVRVGSGLSTSSPHDIEPAMAKEKHLSKASGTPAFAFMNHGGKRKGAGRKAKRHADGSRVEPSHQRRPRFTKSRPLHVTLEVNEEVPNLRAAH
jgi:hypothetical protein